MRTLGYLDPEKRRRIARETLEIYAPIALRLGMNTIRVEFEELGFRALYPLRSSMIEKAVRKARGNRKEVVTKLQIPSLDAWKRKGFRPRLWARKTSLQHLHQDAL